MLVWVLLKASLGVSSKLEGEGALAVNWGHIGKGRQPIGFVYRAVTSEIPELHPHWGNLWKNTSPRYPGKGTGKLGHLYSTPLACWLVEGSLVGECSLLFLAC